MTVYIAVQINVYIMQGTVRPLLSADGRRTTAKPGATTGGHMNNLLKQLLLGGSTTALITAAPMAQAQDATSAPNIETVTVTSSASRIELKGFEAPTPVTVIGLGT